MAKAAGGPVAVDLLSHSKELQLLHGLRVEDYKRYHGYLTRRIHTLRKQLKLINFERRRFSRKMLQPAAVTDPRHIHLLLLVAERAWAHAEELRGESQDPKCPNQQDKHHHYRERMVKAAKEGAVLARICAEANTDQRLKDESAAYAMVLKGQACAARRAWSDAKDCFVEARALYTRLRAASSQEQLQLLVAKIMECDDRVRHCMQCNEEDPMSYAPEADGDDSHLAAFKVQWLGRSIVVTSVPCRDALGKAWDTLAQCKTYRADYLTNNSSLNKLMDVYDRTVVHLNTALDAARQQLQDVMTTASKTDQQLLQQYILFHVNKASLDRTTCLVDVYAHRFELTKAALYRGRKQPKGQFASPPEIVRLYDAAIRYASDCLALPGVGDEKIGEAVEAEMNELRTARLYFISEGWRIVGDTTRACAGYDHVVSLASGGSTFHTKAMAAKTRMLAEAVMEQEDVLASVGSGATVSTRVGKKRLHDNIDDFAVCDEWQQFPPDYQSVPCKPAFCDIAALHVEFPDISAYAGGEGGRRAHPEKHHGAEPQKKAGWFSWGWGAKK